MKFLIPRTIWLIAISFSVVVLSYALFFEWMPKSKEAELREENAKQLREQAAKHPQAKRKIEKANAQIRAVEAKWNAILAEKTPEADVSRGGINLNVNAFQLMIDTKRFRNNVQRAVNKQLLAGGVKVIGPYIPGIGDNDDPNSILASYYNYPAIAFPVVIYDLGQVTVQGTYDQILTHVRAWSKMPRYLAVADGLRLSGTAPILTGTYNLTLVGFIRDSGIYPPVPFGAGAAAPAGGGAAAFGGPGGAAVGGPRGPGAAAFGGPGGPGGAPFGPGGGGPSIQGSSAGR